MLDLGRRVVVLLFALAMVSSHLRDCAGWMPAAEARMACCEDGSCPMHQGEHDASGVTAISQAEADTCCASASERESKALTATLTVVSTAVLGLGVVIPVSAPALVLSDGWRVREPVPLALPPRHVLLSTFLI